MTNGKQQAPSIPKSVKSYTRLLNAGIIKQQVFDDRMKKISSTVGQSSSVPPTQRNNASNGKAPPTSQGNHNHQIAHKNQNQMNQMNHNQNQMNHNSAAKRNDSTAPKSGPSSELASHVISRGAVSNHSGQYPTNGFPGGSMLR
jgi:hypothetical protein